MRCGGRYADGTAQVAADMRQVLLTVDVEALPSRAERDHVARLVFGRFAGHPSMGLREMMAEAEKRSMRLTCFVDYCEYDLYGNAFLDVAREIAARGHDVQLHAHPEVMKPETWARLGLAKPAGSLDGFSESEADRLFDWLLGLHGSVCSAAPVAFRGGGYRCSNNILAAMRRHGLAVSSNHNPGRQNQLDDRESCEVFRHANGVLEVPISVLHRDGARFEFNFNQYGFADSVDWFADAFWNHYGDRSILNLVMHSRSFLAMDARKRFYVPKDVQPTALFRSVLDRFQAWQAEVIGIAQWAEARNLPLAEGEGKGHAHASPALRQPASTVTTPQEVQSVAQVHEVDRPLRPEAARALTPASAARPACPVCGDARRSFVDFNGRRLARCASCAALERQRSLVQAWNANLRHDVPTEGRNALLVSPAKSERMIFAALGFCSLQTLDIRPEARCDIVADLCSMPQVQDESFDLVFASHVLPHVHDLDAALSEIARILTLDGVFLSFTPVRTGEPTTVAEGTQASGWYGGDILQKHQVGSFRSFGDLGLLRDLQRHFAVKTATGEDPITGRRFMWTCAWKLSAADRVRMIPKERRRYFPLQHG